ncbi:MAG: hypothetical protein JJU20_07790 [Opitutales bacterium]|nr:hypothetical protein [Opitutales bacterium]
MNDKHIEKRIAELESIIRKRGGLFSRHAKMPAGLYLSFLEQTIAFDDAYSKDGITGIDMKAEVHAHLELPPEGKLDDHCLTEKLHVLIDLLARFHIFLSFTDHLTDRELYNRVLGSLLDEPFELSIFTPGALQHIDLCNDPDLYEEFYDFGSVTPANRDEWIKVLVEKYRNEPVPEFKSAQAREYFKD